MRMLKVATTILIIIVSTIATATIALAQPVPEFKLGFKALADQIPDVVGQPIENEHWGANGDSLQQTTTGLMVWRKADNWTAFTNGVITWINGPAGVQSRPNSERFDWEALPSIELKGKGAAVTERFDLQEGLKIVHLTHNGKHNFIVHLMDESGETVGYLANEIGAYEGRMAEGVRKSGRYLLNVDADGDWAITIEQPRPSGGSEIPLTFTGKGQSVTPFVQLNPGLVVATMQHNGNRNFIVQLIDKDGHTVEYLSNQIGSWSGEKAFGVKTDGFSGTKPGVHILDVKADGDWTVTLQYR